MSNSREPRVYGFVCQRSKIYIDMRADDLETLRSGEETEAVKMKADDAGLRERTEAYNARIIPLWKKRNDLYSEIREGKRKDGSSLRDDEVIPMLNAYVDSTIQHARAKIEHPYNAEDSREAKLELEHFEDISKSGLEGLSNYCLQQMDAVPRRIVDDQIDDYWKPLYERWERYKKLIDEKIVTESPKY